MLMTNYRVIKISEGRKLSCNRREGGLYVYGQDSINTDGIFEVIKVSHIFRKYFFSSARFLNLNITVVK